MNRLKQLIVMIVITASAAACTPEATQPPVLTEESRETPGAGYPGPTVYEPPYPIEDLSAEIFEQHITPNAPAPEFSAETGAFMVTLRYPDGERPVRGQLFFAAHTIPVPDLEGSFIPALDQNNDPRGQSDGVGVLVISNITPGKYALTLMTPLGPILVETAGDNEPVIFEIVAGELTDLGELVIFLDPEALEP